MQIDFGNLPVQDIRKSIRVNKTILTEYRSLNDITSIALHHSLTEEGDAHAFANYHIGTLGWSRMGYAFVILKDGTIQWAADLAVKTPHVGSSNRTSLGICFVGDFRYNPPTAEQLASAYGLLELLIKILPNVKDAQGVWGHQEYPDYAWKQCPALDMDSLRGQIASKQYGVVTHNFNNDNKRLIVLPADAGPRKTINDPVKVVIEQPTLPATRKLLEYGARGEDVKNLQIRLNDVGSYGLKVDGIFGIATEAAVRDFQKNSKLSVDGVAGPKTFAKLTLPAKKAEKVNVEKPPKSIVPYPGHLIKKGSKDKENIKRVQRAVGVEADGIFGPKTEAAVKAYQKRKKLKQDGIVGPATWNKLF
ncbi:peptidoglycan recognition protein family protein [Fictibacillus sp. 18YEL24]|uniref:peptidoglycan recognition protein family protein n=1 Tax=Fictibacillus sp. 18YEL24 TaxID=2745875 RepID=UPI0018CFDD5B|nr:N-acetylmuramoyl-L-alanine amidase [Fictibacillus sp. 18YEL24]MBH0171005.1 N-acetylmuramoyl-L-alanine amidase [Fictibacillus sp. 18YEL24]